MKTIITEDGFEIKFEALAEECPVEDMLSFAETGCDHSSTIRKVHNGEFEYFVAHVTASKNGIELASDYLGGCIYKSEDEFVEAKGDYFDDMKATVIAEAKEAIKGLCEVA